MVGGDLNSEQDLSSDDLHGFTTALNALKRAGCLILVTGTVDETVRAATSRRLFGVPTLPRERILIPTDDTALEPASYLPPGITPENKHVHLCDWDPLLRGTAIEPEGDRLTSDGGPPELAACSRRLTRVLPTESIAGTPSSGELRVGLLTLPQILDRYGRTATGAFLSRFGQHIRAYRGIGHCHLPLPSDSTPAASLANTADIHIHLRETSGTGPEQRWYLNQTEYSSAWMPLDIP